METGQLTADPGRGADVVRDVCGRGLERAEGLDPRGAIADYGDAFIG